MHIPITIILVKLITKLSAVVLSALGTSLRIIILKVCHRLIKPKHMSLKKTFLQEIFLVQPLVFNQVRKLRSSTLRYYCMHMRVCVNVYLLFHLITGFYITSGIEVNFWKFSNK